MAVEGALFIKEKEDNMKTKKAVSLGVTLLLMTLLTLPLGCTKETVAPTLTDFKTFSKYGFSFDYPRGYSITEMGMLESEATNASGTVQAWKGDYEVYQAAWLAMVESMWEVSGDLQTTLEDTFVGMEEAEEVARLDKGELVETTKAGHGMVYQYYTVTYTEGSKGYGIAAIFYCDRSERFFQLITVHTAISAKQDIAEDFQYFLESFICH